MKIIFVCLGNICRSPLAEGIFRAKTESLGLDWQLDSAGIGGWHSGESPDKRSVNIALKFHVNIADQLARQLTYEDLENFDVIFVMDNENKLAIAKLAQNADFIMSKVKMIGSFTKLSINNEIPDPYYDNNLFEPVFKMLDDACDHYINQCIRPSSPSTNFS